MDPVATDRFHPHPRRYVPPCLVVQAGKAQRADDRQRHRREEIGKTAEFSLDHFMKHTAVSGEIPELLSEMVHTGESTWGAEVSGELGNILARLLRRFI